MAFHCPHICSLTNSYWFFSLLLSYGDCTSTGALSQTINWGHEQVHAASDTSIQLKSIANYAIQQLTLVLATQVTWTRFIISILRRPSPLYLPTFSSLPQSSLSELNKNENVMETHQHCISGIITHKFTKPRVQSTQHGTCTLSRPLADPVLKPEVCTRSGSFWSY